MSGERRTRDGNVFFVTNVARSDDAERHSLWHCDLCKMSYVGDMDTLDPERRSASSCHNDNVGPDRGRLSSSTAWSANTSKKGTGRPYWHQCDVGKIRRLSGILLKGRKDQDQWPTKVSVALSCDGISWTRVVGERSANNDSNSPVFVRVPTSTTDEERGLDELRRDARVETTQVEWHERREADAFPGHDVCTVTHLSKKQKRGDGGSMDELRRRCVENGWGGFVVWNDAAYFRSKSGAELIAAMKEKKDGPVVHALLAGKMPPSHAALIERGHARYVRVYVHAYHKHPSLRMGIVVDPAYRRRRHETSWPFRCVSGCDFDLCRRCVRVCKLRQAVRRATATRTGRSKDTKRRDESSMTTATDEALIDFALRASSRRLRHEERHQIDSVGRAASRSLALMRRPIRDRQDAPLSVLSCIQKMVDIVERPFNTMRFDGEIEDDGVTRLSSGLSQFKIIAKEATRDIMHVRSLRQVNENTCGYYSLWNARCLIRATRASSVSDMLLSLLNMYDRKRFDEWKNVHQDAVKREAKTYFWNEANAKSGVLGQNESDFIIQLDPELRRAHQSGYLTCMSAIGVFDLNSDEQIEATAALLEQFARTKRTSGLAHVLVLGAHDHWICVALIRSKQSKTRCRKIFDSFSGDRPVPCETLTSDSFVRFNASFLRRLLMDLQARSQDDGQAFDPSNASVREAIEILSLSLDCAVHENVKDDRSNNDGTVGEPLGDLQMLLVESENKRVIACVPDNERRVEVQRLTNMIWDCCIGSSSLIKIAITQKVQSFLRSFIEHVDDKASSSDDSTRSAVRATGPTRSIESFAAFRGGAAALRSIRAKLTKFGASVPIEEILETPTHTELSLTLTRALRSIATVGVLEFGRSESTDLSRSKTPHRRFLPSLRKRDGTLWIESFVTEAIALQKKLGVAIDKDIERLTFPPPIAPPIARAKRLSQMFVGMSKDDAIELLMAFDDNESTGAGPSDEDVAAAVRFELSLRPKCGKGHPLRPALRHGHTCDVCKKKKKTTSFRCSAGCDYDVRAESTRFFLLTSLSAIHTFPRHRRDRCCDDLLSRHRTGMSRLL